MSKIYMFNMLSPKNEVPKRRAFLGEKEISLMPGNSLDNPRFKLSGGFFPPTLNYIYFDKFNRFYYVDDIIAESNDTFTLICSSDPLFSMWDRISTNQFLVDRQEFKYNPLMEDPCVQMETGAQITKKIIGNVGKTISYVLTVTGGGE